MVGGIEDPILVGGIKDPILVGGIEEPSKVAGIEEGFDSSNKLPSTALDPNFGLLQHPISIIFPRDFEGLLRDLNYPLSLDNYRGLRREKGKEVR